MGTVAGSEREREYSGFGAMGTKGCSKKMTFDD